MCVCLCVSVWKRLILTGKTYIHYFILTFYLPFKKFCDLSLLISLLFLSYVSTCIPLCCTLQLSNSKLRHNLFYIQFYRTLKLFSFFLSSMACIYHMVGANSSTRNAPPFAPLTTLFTPKPPKPLQECTRMSLRWPTSLNKSGTCHSSYYERLKLLQNVNQPLNLNMKLYTCDYEDGFFWVVAPRSPVGV
jgi:hypothetical protein